MSETVVGKQRAALTPREWAAADFGDYPRTFALYWANAAQVDEECPQALHKVAALALLRQPFGFTRADVQALRSAYTVLECEESGKPSAETLLLLSLADRIESLLPPEA